MFVETKGRRRCFHADCRIRDGFIFWKKIFALLFYESQIVIRTYFISERTDYMFGATQIKSVG